MIYDFRCDKCDESFERFFKMNDKKNAFCPLCEGQARRVYSVLAPDFGFKPYWSDALCREPNKQVYVESLSHKKSLMKKYGLVEYKTDKKQF